MKDRLKILPGKPVEKNNVTCKGEEWRRKF